MTCSIIEIERLIGMNVSHGEDLEQVLDYMIKNPPYEKDNLGLWYCKKCKDPAVFVKNIVECSKNCEYQICLNILKQWVDGPE